MNEQTNTWAMLAVGALLSLAFAAGVLACTMVGAVVLGALAALVLWVNRAQVWR